MLYGVNAIAVRRNVFAFLMMVSSSAIAQSTHIFISFSMPNTSLMQWVEQADKTDSSVHLRGFVDNSFKQTMHVTHTIIKESNAGGILIDPKLFEQYHIDKVPAVVFVEDDQHYTVVYGDIGLKAASEIAITHTDSKAARKIMEKLSVT